MSTVPSAIALKSPGLRAVELKTAAAAWVLFIVGTCCYCLVHQAVVSAVTPDLGRTLAVALREWGGWVALAPLAFAGFRHASAGIPRPWRAYVAVCLLAGLGAALVPILIDQFTQTRSLGASAAIFLPRNLLAAAVVYLIWHASLRSRADRRASSPATDSSSRSTPGTLLVSKGADQCLIGVDDIQYLSAAGNYIDICARDQRYLLRGTMRQMADLLPAERFIRIHRSHIVRIDQIERIKVQRSGNGTVHLRCGTSLGISKGYRGHLQRQRIQSLLQ